MILNHFSQMAKKNPKNKKTKQQQKQKKNNKSSQIISKPLKHHKKLLNAYFYESVNSELH